MKPWPPESGRCCSDANAPSHLDVSGGKGRADALDGAPRIVLPVGVGCVLLVGTTSNSRVGAPCQRWNLEAGTDRP